MKKSRNTPDNMNAYFILVILLICGNNDHIMFWSRYLYRLAATYGFEVVICERHVLRTQNDVPVRSLSLVMRRGKELGIE